jgi:hypothetical protein
MPMPAPSEPWPRSSVPCPTTTWLLLLAKSRLARASTNGSTDQLRSGSRSVGQYRAHWTPDQT